MGGMLIRRGVSEKRCGAAYRRPTAWQRVLLLGALLKMQDIANGGHGEQEARPFRFWLNFLAQVMDVRFDEGRFAALMAPEALQDRARGDHLARVGNQQLQQAPFSGREAIPATIARDFLARRIDAGRANLDRAAAGSSGEFVGAAPQRIDTRLQLAHGDWLDQEIVCALLQSACLLFLLARVGQHQNQAHSLQPQALAKVSPIGPWKG
jgi:hypothetical protein